MLKISLCNLFRIKKVNNIASYTDDNTHYITGDGIGHITKSLDDDFINLFKWLLYIKMKANRGKCYLITYISKVVLEMQKLKTILEENY